MSNIDDQLEGYYEENGHEWPNCAVPDCENKRCCWAGTERCYPCSVRLLGIIEIERRYSATHDARGRWTGAIAT